MTAMTLPTRASVSGPLARPAVGYLHRVRINERSARL